MRREYALISSRGAAVETPLISGVGDKIVAETDRKEEEEKKADEESLLRIKARS